MKLATRERFVNTIEKVPKLKQCKDQLTDNDQWCLGNTQGK
jgi:hypothetical protein